MVFDCDDYERVERKGHKNTGLSQKQIDEIKKVIEERNIKNLYSNKKRMFNSKEYDKYYNTPLWESTSRKNLLQIHPDEREDAKAFMNEAFIKYGIKLVIRDVHRSIKEQNKLYSYGRKPNSDIIIDRKKIRTKAPGGASMHHYGLAFDVYELKNGDIVHFDRNIIIPLAIKYGFKWGGHFKSFYDPPHFERTYGFKWKRLKSKAKNEKGKFVDLRKK
ncbi:MAG: M15 family metallopeptidase [Bacteroidetes bacterium]|nr:M15 family metallopeptidase [Bacteroidota bacterium]